MSFWEFVRAGAVGALIGAAVWYFTRRNDRGRYGKKGLDQ